jgi:hypothetical protein
MMAAPLCESGLQQYDASSGQNLQRLSSKDLSRSSLFQSASLPFEMVCEVDAVAARVIADAERVVSAPFASPFPRDESDTSKQAIPLRPGSTFSTTTSRGSSPIEDLRARVRDLTAEESASATPFAPTSLQKQHGITKQNISSGCSPIHSSRESYRAEDREELYVPKGGQEVNRPGITMSLPRKDKPPSASWCTIL